MYRGEGTYNSSAEVNVLLDHDELLKFFVDKFKEKYGVECIAALHHNKRRTNFHSSYIFREGKAA